MAIYGWENYEDRIYKEMDECFLRIYSSLLCEFNKSNVYNAIINKLSNWVLFYQINAISLKLVAFMCNKIPDKANKNT